MSEKAKRDPAVREPLTGEAAWLAHKEAIARRNDEARRLGRERRRVREEEEAAQRRAAELLETAALAKLKR
jgi:hypothetical protein